ncbi:MAG: helix-turn-helix domain-containing protein [Anaerolineae bacterium]|nr:helix-turn-helix domain-containing protein [Anaerolineae bacterium]
MRNPDKEQLRAEIFVMVQQGMSYRKIGAALGIHWTRVQQIVKWG